MGLPTKTPCLLLDKTIVHRNCERMASKLAGRGIRLRPHMKTAKSYDVAKVATATHFGGITVSTLAEADYFAEHGINDITYAVSIVPPKLLQAARIARSGCRLGLITDDLTTIYKIGKAARKMGVRFPVSIEIDCGGGRGGISPTDPMLLKIAATIVQAPALEFEGILTHAGHAYHAGSVAQIRQIAQEERTSVVTAARRLGDRGITCSVTSTGSTPTATHIDNCSGITEMRPGVYMFGDLDQVGLGSCVTSDIALTVLSTVIGHNRRTGRILIDAGALALSKDSSASANLSEVGFGRVFDHSDLFVAEVNQEHGFVVSKSGTAAFDRFPIGSQLRVLPNHACLTAAAYNRYHVIDDGAVVAEWGRVNGW